ncbi:MAG: TolC family protein [Cytophagaceae bacterium]
MLQRRYISYCVVSLVGLAFTACLPSITQKSIDKKNIPSAYITSATDTTNTATSNWKMFITDPNLVALIDTALKNNQDLNIIQQEIRMAQYEVKARKGAYLPFVGLFAGGSVDKVGKYTRTGAVDENLQIIPGKNNPDNITNMTFGAMMSWQVDIWKQLRNGKKAAVERYLATMDGKNFMVTNLIAEIAFQYYELLALDNQLEILKNTIDIQEDALKIVTLQKTAGQVTELAVSRFQAEVNKNLSRRYLLEQRIIVTQNNINFLLGRYPQEIKRDATHFTNIEIKNVQSGIPSQLLDNRPDIKQAEKLVNAAKLDVKAAKASFYPALTITAGAGYESFNARYLVSSPQSVLYNVAGGLMAPLINRNAIKAQYLTANAKQVQAVYGYEKTLLGAYTEVYNQLSLISNLSKSYDHKNLQVEALNRSVNVSVNLFKSARADYVEVLLTQRDMLDSKMELIDIKKEQLNASVKMYQALGGGWK